MTFTVAAWVGNKQGSVELFVSQNTVTLSIAYSLFFACVLVFGGSAVFFGFRGLCVLFSVCA